MADLEAVLADVSYLMAMEKSKCTPAARASKKIVLPDPRFVCHFKFITIFHRNIGTFTSGLCCIWLAMVAFQTKLLLISLSMFRFSVGTVGFGL